MSLIKIKYTEVGKDLVLTIEELHESVTFELKKISYFRCVVDNVTWCVRLNEIAYFNHPHPEKSDMSPTIYLPRDKSMNSVLINCNGEFSKERYIRDINKTLELLIKQVKSNN